MVKLYLNDLDDFIFEQLPDDLYEIMSEDMSVTVVGSYELVINILNGIKYFNDEDYYSIVSCKIEPVEYSGYDEAYLITFCGEDGDVYVEKAYSEHGNQYLIDYADVTYVEEKFWDKWSAVNGDSAIRLIVGKEKKVPEKKDGQKFEVDQDGKGFTFCANDGNSCINCVYRSSENIPTEFINDMRKLLRGL